MTLERLSIPVCFDLSFLRIRWSDHIFARAGVEVVGEGVVYGGNWKKAERLARQMAEMKFGAKRGDLPVCEQVFISGKKVFDSESLQTRRGEGRRKKEIQEIVARGSSLKVKAGRNVFDDEKTLLWIKETLRFPHSIRIDANQGYSLKQLQYLIPTLKQCGIVYVEEPVKARDLPAAIDMLHRYGLKVILDETLAETRSSPSVIPGSDSSGDPESIQTIFDAMNIKLSRIGDVNEALQFIKLAKKHRTKVIIGCSEELERGMEAIYALGHEAKRMGILLEVEGYGPLRLAPSNRKGTQRSVPRWVNRVENISLILRHKVRQIMFDLWWDLMRIPIVLLKQSKKLSSLSLRLVELTGKYSGRMHPKHLVITKEEPEYLQWIKSSDTVLDIGCGNGQHALRVALKVKEVTGFDVDDIQLRLAREAAARIGAKNATFEHGSAMEQFPHLPGQFNCVLFLGVLEHLEDRGKVLKEVWRVLKPGGKLLLGVPNEMTSWKKTQMRFGVSHYTDPDHKIEFTKASIRQLLKSHKFKITKIQPTAYDTPLAGFIDLAGGISLKWYRKLLEWKWGMVRRYPDETISFFVVAQKV